jgi:hypothetical protein
MANSVFVSPGVYTSEKDLTFVTRQVGVTTLGMAGETVKGPAFNPVFISNYDEFKTFFGGLNPTKFTDTGTPKYELPYIAKSYLSTSNQLFVSRVLGFSGYDAGATWGIVLNAAMDISTTATTVPTTTGTSFITYDVDSGDNVTGFTSTETLINTLYSQDKLFNITNSIGTKTVGETGSTGTIIWSKESDDVFSGVSFDYIITNITGNTGTADATAITYYSGASYSDVQNKIVATLRSRGKYDGDEKLVFECGDGDVIIDNTITTAYEDVLGNFRLSASSITQGAVTYDVSFDNKSKNYISKVLGHTQADGKTAIFVDSLYKNMLDDYNSEGKIMGVKLSLIPYDIVFDNYKSQYSPAVTPYVVSEVRGSNIIRLFRLWTISDGDTANSEIKISIENIKLDDKTFDVVVRSFYDTDERPVKLERFTNCTMDKASNNYIGRRIGTLDGEYPSMSNYILVEFDSDNDYADAIPGGFLGVPVKDYTKNNKPTVQAPSISYKKSYTTFENKRKVYLGLSDTVGIDQNFFNYNGIPDDANVNIWTGMTKGFHMDKDATGATIDAIAIPINLTGDTYQPVYSFEVGVAEFRTEAGVQGTPYESIKARKFTLAPYGGFDGWDIYRTKRTNTDTYAINGTKGQAGLVSGIFENLPLSNGQNGITSDYYAYLEAIRTFSNPEAVNINVFTTPGIDTSNNGKLIEETIEMIETERADSLYVVTTPDLDASGYVKDPADVADYLTDLFDSNYTCTYWPWIQVQDAENNQYIWLPPTRDVVRNIARTDNIAYPWFAAAGVNRGDVDCVKARTKLSLEQRDTLYEARINPIATFATEGVKIWGNKTLQIADTALNRINVRRLLLQARKLISAVSIRLLFEQNDAIVRNQFLGLVNPILDGIRKERGITDFRVTVDSSPESIDRNELIGKIYLKPTRALEFIQVDFVLTPTGASFDNI